MRFPYHTGSLAVAVRGFLKWMSSDPILDPLFEQQKRYREIATETARIFQLQEQAYEKQLEEIGKRFIKVGKLMKERVDVKNMIARETGKGFEEIKLKHSAEL